MKAGLCLNCLKAGHVAAHCSLSVVCQKCSRNHHNLLHFETNAPLKSQDARVGCTTVCGDHSSSAFCAKVLLVDLSLASDPSRSIRVYAIIDEQSDTTVVDEKVADYFGGSFPTRDITTRFVTNKAVFRHEAKILPELKVRGVMSRYSETLKGALTYPSVADNKHQVATPDIVRRFSHAAKYSKYFPNLDVDAEVLVLIGLDNVHIHRSDRLTKDAPYVHRTPLGYALVGKVCDESNSTSSPASILRIQTCDMMASQLEQYDSPLIKSTFQLKKGSKEFDVNETRTDDDEAGMSADDLNFLHIMAKGETVGKRGELSYPLPITREFGLPDNRDTVYRRTSGTLRSLKRSPDKLDTVLKIIENDFIDLKSGHVEQLKDEKRSVGSDWYLPPFVVTHKRKLTPRLVYDAAAEFEGISLNKLLLQGPDLLSGLRQILLSFREKSVAVSADIRGMFLNFKVDPEHRRFLRFFWFAENDPDKNLVPYQINTHAFGLKSSPAVANFALKSIATEKSSSKTDKFDDPVSLALERSFYVDDLLTSTDTAEEAGQLLKRLSKRLGDHGILLHKFASNNRDSLEGLPDDSLSLGMRDLPDETGEQSALGVKWDTCTDTLSLSLKLPQREFTKRGILSVIGSLYDPIGLISPVILGGRLFQREVLPRRENADDELLKLDWDDPLPPKLLCKWRSWCLGLQGLDQLSLPRCLHPTDIIPVRQHLCAFSDASEEAMGYVIYLLTEDSEGVLHIGFVCGNSKVAPKNSNTIPRLELNAALLAARALATVKKSLTRAITSYLCFTDSRIVLGYLSNKTRRLKRYVERRVTAIKNLTPTNSWFYVPTNENPADIATHPVTPKQLLESEWFSGPKFLLDKISFDNKPADVLPETVEEGIILSTKVVKTNTFCDDVFNRTNSLICAERITRTALALLHKLDLARQRLGVSLAPRNPKPCLLFALDVLCSITQEEHYPSEINSLLCQKSVLSTSCIHRLSPWLDNKGLIRMAGRLANSGLPWCTANPLILPSSSSLSRAIVLHYHHQCHHQGATITRSAITNAGFHITGGSRLVKSILHKCVMCRRLRGKAQEQKMSNLPAVRVTPSPPFTNVGVDLFGPFHIKDTIATRRHNSTSKMWGCVFTCLSSRAVHFEALASLDASSFLNALTRFCAIRGYPCLIRSDRGGNFVSASKKLSGINAEEVGVRLEALNIKWEFNPPHASHFGGVWERMVGAARRVMEGMMQELHMKTLDMESFVTLLAEASRIINFTPLWVTSWDTDEPAPLCPADVLLINKCKYDFDVEPVSERDILAYGSRRHRRATYLVSNFWRRWESDYLITLNQRSKWFRRNDIEIGDIVLVIDPSACRTSWPLAVVKEIHPGNDGNVRSVTLKVGGSPPKTMLRPICKTISILPNRYKEKLPLDHVVPLT